MPSTPFSRFDASSFSIFKRSMMQTGDLPVSDVIDDSLIQELFDKHDIDFGADSDAVYTPAITLWALISQVFFSGEQRSCKAAVSRVASLWAALGRRVCDTNTGANCRARARIPFAVVREIVQRWAADAEAAVSVVGSEVEEQTPKVVADIKSIPTKGRVFLVDGFTVTAADTAENQAEYPQNPAQAEGLGFPILRCVSLISLRTGLLFDLAVGPYSGKESGEEAKRCQEPIVMTMTPTNLVGSAAGSTARSAPIRQTPLPGNPIRSNSRILWMAAFRSEPSREAP